MTSNHEELSIDIALENWTCSVQIYYGCTYLRQKSNEGTSDNWISF